MNLNMLYLYSIENKHLYIKRINKFYHVINFDKMVCTWYFNLSGYSLNRTEQSISRDMYGVWKRGSSFNSSKFEMDFTVDTTSFSEQEIENAYKKYLNAKI
jgi:hypothetical protein